MNINEYSLEDLLLASLKSEVESRDIYLELSKRVRNYMLKDRLKFLSEEEDKHRKFFETLLKTIMGDKEIILHEKSPVPLPSIEIGDENMPLSQIFAMAMEAEKAAHNFYKKLAEKFKDREDIHKMILYIAEMELGHYRLFEIERENAEKFEDYDSEWPMIHLGP